MKPIPYGRQSITQADIDAVVRVLQSDFLTQGPQIAEFETAFAKYTGSRYAVAVANGTAALHLCTLAMDVQPGDKVITTPITFAASANCIRYAGGEVLFADIDPETYLADLKKVEEILKKEKNVRGIIPVDFSGRAVNLEAFRKLANKYNCWIIEDACHAPGGYFEDSKGQKQLCGNGNFADLAIFSFHPVKHIAAGEGGMITTNDGKLYKKLLTLRTHGITKNVELFQNSPEMASGFQPLGDDTQSTNNHLKTEDHKDVKKLMREKLNDGPGPKDYPSWYYEMQELGFNYRLTDFQAALANEQLKRADEGLGRRKKIAQNYFEAFNNRSFIINQSGVVTGHAYHLYIIEVKDRKGLYDHLRANNIFAQIHYVPVHLMPYYKQYGWNYGDLPLAEQYYSRCISLPMYPSLTNEEQKFVINCIINYYNNQ